MSFLTIANLRIHNGSNINEKKKNLDNLSTNGNKGLGESIFLKHGYADLYGKDQRLKKFEKISIKSGNLDCLFSSSKEFEDSVLKHLILQQSIRKYFKYDIEQPLPEVFPLIPRVFPPSPRSVRLP